MTNSENITRKSNYQLRWIAANKSTYSENHIKAALEELKKREIVKTKLEDIKNSIKKLWDSIYQFFK